MIYSIICQGYHNVTKIRFINDIFNNLLGNINLNWFTQLIAYRSLINELLSAFQHCNTGHLVDGTQNGKQNGTQNF